MSEELILKDITTGREVLREKADGTIIINKKLGSVGAPSDEEEETVKMSGRKSDDGKKVIYEVKGDDEGDSTED